MYTTKKSSCYECSIKSQPVNVGKARLISGLLYSFWGQYLWKHNNKVHDWRYVTEIIHDGARSCFIFSDDHRWGSWEISSYWYNPYSYQGCGSLKTRYESYYIICHFIGSEVLWLFQWSAYYQYPWSQISGWYILHNKSRGELYRSKCCYYSSDSSHPIKRRYSLLFNRSRWNLVSYLRNQ